MNMKIDSYTPSNPVNAVNPVNGTGYTNSGNSVTAASNAVTRKQANNPVDQNQESTNNVQVKDAVKVANDIMKMFDSRARFEYSVDDTTKMEVVKIVDRDNGQLIRQYPPQEILNMVAKMYDMFGIIIDKKA